MWTHQPLANGWLHNKEKIALSYLIIDIIVPTFISCVTWSRKDFFFFHTFPCWEDFFLLFTIPSQGGACQDICLCFHLPEGRRRESKQRKPSSIDLPNRGGIKATSHWSLTAPGTFCGQQKHRTTLMTWRSLPLQKNPLTRKFSTGNSAYHGA